MTAQPKVSVIIPTLNRALLLQEAICSVMEQTYKNWECLVIDDGSEDDTQEMVQHTAKIESRIQFFKRPVNKNGAPACRNFGLDICSGELVIFLDSDDLLAPTCLENRVNFFLENNKCDFLVFPVLIFNKEIDDLNLLWNIDKRVDDLTRFLKTDAVWQTSSVIYKKEIVKSVQGFRESLSFWQDFDLHLRLLLMRPVYKKFLHQQPDCFHRNHDDRISKGVNVNSAREILYKKINFYLWQMNFIQKNGLVLSRTEYITIWNTYMYFANLTLTLNHTPKLYFRYWRKSLGFFRSIWGKHLVTLLYHYTFYFVEAYKLPGIIRRTFLKYFKKQIADQDIFSDHTIAKIKVQVATLGLES